MPSLATRLVMFCVAIAASGMAFGQDFDVVASAHHGYVWVRNIKIRPVCSTADGWKPVWNDKDLSQFTCNGPN